jgi:glutamate synthase domain-containing protein 3
MLKIDAKGIKYKELNFKIREAIRNGEKEIDLANINGQRYIGDNLDGDLKITIHGVPGNDLAYSMNGPEIVIHGNGQDAICNTMSSGKVIIHGNAGDICGYAMRGGKIYIKGNVGYRSGIHMKEYKDIHPVIVIGGSTGDFLGEYMAGGLLIVLGLNSTEDNTENVGKFCGTGMHGGRMFIRGKIPDWSLGKEVKVTELNDQDKTELQGILDEYSKDLGIDVMDKIKMDEFKKLYPGSKRPYGKLYAY